MANQIYCKHCGKQIDADSAFCMHCGGAINSDNKTTPQANKQDVSFIRQLDILGIAGAILLIYLGCEEVEEYRAMFMVSAIILIILTLYFSCSKSIKLILPSSILLLCSYGAFIYYDHEHIYGSNTTFFDTVKREFYWITPNYTIPDHATSIGSGAFLNCDGLTSITIPDSVTSIGELAFPGCVSLPVIDGIMYAGSVMVEVVDKNRTSYSIKSGVRYIPSYAFYDCASLTSVTIGNSVTEIGERAFCKCTSLTSVYCKPTTPPTGCYKAFSYDYSGDNTGCKIYVPRNSVEAYKSAEGWKNYAAYIVGYDF